MAKFKFNIEAGIVNRIEVRQYLAQLKTDLEFKFDGDVLIDEDKRYLDSLFLVRGFNFPETVEFKKHIEKVILAIKFAEDY